MGTGLISKEVTTTGTAIRRNKSAYWRKVEVDHGGVRRPFRSGLTPTVLFFHSTVTDIDGTPVRLSLKLYLGLVFSDLTKTLSGAEPNGNHNSPT